MSTSNRVLLIEMGRHKNDPLPESLQQALITQGVEVNRMEWTDGVEAILDRVAEGSIPVVIKPVSESKGL